MHRLLLVCPIDKASRHLADLLTQSGYSVGHVSSATAAQEHLLQERWQGVFCNDDIHDLSAAELCLWLRMIPGAPYVHFTVLSDEKNQGRLLTAMTAGADDYLLRPFTENKVTAALFALERTLALHQSLDKANHRQKTKHHDPERTAPAARRPEPTNLAFADTLGPHLRQTLPRQRGTTGEAEARPWRILVADDDPDMLDLMAFTVELKGMPCYRANDGFQAAALALKHDVDIVISDWMMPGHSGVELCKLVRAAIRKPLFFIIATTLRDNENFNEAFSAGVNAYLTKPIDPDKVHASLLGADRFLRTAAGIGSDPR